MFFLSLLIKVVDLHEVPPESALEFCKLLPDHRTRILVCGGDGSVGWVLAALDKVKLKVCKDELIAFAWLLLLRRPYIVCIQVFGILDANTLNLTNEDNKWSKLHYLGKLKVNM